MRRSAIFRQACARAFVLALAAAFLLPSPDAGAARSALRIGDRSPQFSLPDLAGRPVTVPDDLRGKAVIVHFWADWCQFCLEEMPALDGIYRQYRDRGLTVIAVNVGQNAESVRAYAQRMGISYQILLDKDGRIAKKYEVVGLPRTFFLDREGHIKYKLLGEATAKTLGKLAVNTL